MKCPGQDLSQWKPGDIFEVRCPKCGNVTEFFKDESVRKCKCGTKLKNPRLDVGCLEWCQFADKCSQAIELAVATIKDK